MQFPSRRARVALLAGAGALTVAAPRRRRSHDRLRRRHRQAHDRLRRHRRASRSPSTAARSPSTASPRRRTPTTSSRSRSARPPTAPSVNEIDLSAVTAAGFPQLASTLVRAEGGNDDITGTQLADRIEGGRQRRRHARRRRRRHARVEQRRGHRRHVRRRRRRHDREQRRRHRVRRSATRSTRSRPLDGGGFKFSRLPNPAVAAPGRRVRPQRQGRGEATSTTCSAATTGSPRSIPPSRSPASP